MRRVCEPVVAKRSVFGCVSQYAPSCHPQPDSPVFVESGARLTIRPVVVPIAYSAAPPASTASENCTKTESLYFELLVARMRSHT